jgi:hypothetical protein
MSDNYDSENQVHWQESGFPDFYLAMAAERRGGYWWWCDIGDAPSGGQPAIPRNQAYLALTNVNFAETPLPEWKKEPRGTLNAYVVWHHPERPFKVKDKTAIPPDLVDTPERFEAAIRIGEIGHTLNGQSVPPTMARYGQTDITPWRFQQFKVRKGQKYLWTNRKVATGQLLQAGVVEADGRRLVTIPGFLVDRDAAGNKLILEPAAGKDVPRVDATAKVGDLPYNEYVRQCQKPVAFPPVKPPATAFRIADFTAVGSGNPDGSVTFKGGSFSGIYDTIVQVEKAGPYIITVRAKAEFGAAWPLLVLDVGGRYGQRMETKTIDTTDWAPYRWYAHLDAGKLPMRLSVPNEYYMAPTLPDLRNQRLHIADMTLAHAAEPEKAPVEVSVSPRGVTVPAGMPIRFTAKALNAMGQAIQAPVKWTCSAPARIDAAGRFQADQQGKCIVTAEAAGITGSVSVQVVDRFTDDFNSGTGVLRFWSGIDLSDQKSQWHPPRSGHDFLNSLWQYNAAATSILLWDHGPLWTDYGIQADVILTPRDKGQPFTIGRDRKAIHGLVVRAADRDDHYRLEIERRDDGSRARLVKRRGGAETILAQTDAPPALAPFDWKTNPMCPGWHDLLQVKAEERGLHQWQMDRMRLQAVGDTLRAWINGKEVFPSGVKDGALKAGTAGLYSQGKTIMDNVEVQPAK